MAGADSPRTEQAPVTMVVPAFNEADTLPTTMPQFVACVRERGWDLIVVNDCSSDATPQILSTYDGTDRVRVLQHKVRRGYGGALKTGIAHATSTYVVTVDADGQHQLDDVDSVFTECQRVGADMVVGDRGGIVLVCFVRSGRG